ncbi:MAG TPA: Ig-like domain-containing protein [Nocardioidaceae bacterium]|nr:Ig-like domain-containing protein [Nocardioidaceae bacterium]
MSRSSVLVVACLVLATLSFGMPEASTASFTARTTNPSSRISSAADWTPPVVSVNSPGSTVTGNVDVSASAHDVDSAIATVQVQVAATNGSWVTLCTSSSAPYRCTWDSPAFADGGYRLRAVATDTAGYSATSDTVTATVLNTAVVVLGHPGALVKASVPLSARVSDAGPRPASLGIEYRLAGGLGPWTRAGGCASSGATVLDCTWDTTTVGSDYYDLRAIAVIGSTTYTDTVTDVLVDNVAPAVSMTDPGSPLRGTVTVAATAVDDESGVARVLIDYSSGSGWTTACTLGVAPFTCRLDTTKLADGSYAFRATAVDNAGNTRTSATVSNRTVNNTVASVSMEDPGAYLSGTVALAASASSTNGIGSVSIQRRRAGSGFTDVCTDTTAPYSCSWDTTKELDGDYDLRAVLTDSRGTTLTSDVLTGRRVDNSPLRGADVQTVNAGTAPGRMDLGDQIVFSYTAQVAPGSVLGGWTGAAQSVNVRLRDGRLVGLPGSEDVLDVQTAAGKAVNLGSVNLRQDYAKKSKTIIYAGSQMVATTALVNGQPRTVVTVTLGVPSLSAVATAGAAATMVWTPSGAATDLAGKPCSTAPVSESGATDKDF